MALAYFGIALAAFAVLSGWVITTTNMASFPEAHIWIGSAIGWALGMVFAVCSNDSATL